MKKKINIDKFVSDLGLNVIYAGRKETMILEIPDINRPGLQFANFFNYFSNNRVQVIGMAETMFLLEKPKEYRKEICHKFFSYDIPCIIVARGLRPLEEMMTRCMERGVPIFSTDHPTADLTQMLVAYLTDVLAPEITRHGVLMDIYGIGIMMIGESGIGKSETAVELIKRRHRLVADDAIVIKKIGSKELIGFAPAYTKYLMEIRGIGIIDVSKMYGIAAIKDKKTINLVIELEMWNENKEYERLGTDQKYTNILGVDIPYMLIPVRPGRNLAIVVEASARYSVLKSMGVNAAQQLVKRLDEIEE